MWSGVHLQSVEECGVGGEELHLHPHQVGGGGAAQADAGVQTSNLDYT